MIDSDKYCTVCPLSCGADRAVSCGACGVGTTNAIGDRDPYTTAFVARAARHFYEEPTISGTCGSGAIFFSGCNLACCFCQNKDISASIKGVPMDAAELADTMLRLQSLGAHNINLVTPTPHLKLLKKSIPIARRSGLHIPIVYNTNAYETVESVSRLEGLVDIYLPDLKYVSSELSLAYSSRGDYFSFASAAIKEMFRQCGKLKTNENGIAVSGIIIRHLVLPGSIDETRRVLDFIADNFPLDIDISLMRQYTPIPGMKPPLDRKLLKREYDRAVDYAVSLGFSNLLIQGSSSANSVFTPLFDGFLE